MIRFAYMLLGACALALLQGIYARNDERTVEAVKQAEKPKLARVCDGLWVVQYEAGDRQHLKPKAPACVPSADLTQYRELPNHLFTLPVAERSKE